MPHDPCTHILATKQYKSRNNWRTRTQVAFSKQPTDKSIPLPVKFATAVVTHRDRKRNRLLPTDPRSFRMVQPMQCQLLCGRSHLALIPGFDKNFQDTLGCIGARSDIPLDVIHKVLLGIAFDSCHPLRNAHPQTTACTFVLDKRFKLVELQSTNDRRRCNDSQLPRRIAAHFQWKVCQ